MQHEIVSSEIAALRSRGAYFPAVDFGLIEISGKDAPRFLQSQTTNDILSLNEQKGQLSCLLDRKAHVEAYFHIFKLHDSFRIIVEKDQIPVILAHLEEYKFNDKVDVLDLSQTGAFFAIQGPDVYKVLRAADPQQSYLSPNFRDGVSELKLWGLPVQSFAKSVTGEVGYFIWVRTSQFADFCALVEKTCASLGWAQLSDQALLIARIEAGLAKFKVDFSPENLLPETGLEETTASYTKGCFLGQEVLARVKSHGAPTRALVGFKFLSPVNKELSKDAKLIVNGEEVAVIKSNGFSQLMKAEVALAFVKREWRVPDKVLAGELDGQSVEVKVTLLPFYKAESTDVRARRLYGQALNLFPTEPEHAVESQSVNLLHEALDLDPLLEDAYEALAVILSKRDQLDEAIAVIKKLIELNPDSIMAHTNLSVFYMYKGLKEEAEEEKAISMSIRMRLAAQAADLAKQGEEEKQKRKQETTERMEMFKQVLAIDSEDLLANYGLGSCLVDLEQFDEAIPYLVKAIAIKSTHTVAYEALGKAYEALDKQDEAIAILEKGIEVASKRGDMTPLHQMQDRLTHLKGKRTPV